jgi:hypothetical protein
VSSFGITGGAASRSVTLDTAPACTGGTRAAAGCALHAARGTLDAARWTLRTLAPVGTLDAARGTRRAKINVVDFDSHYLVTVERLAARVPFINRFWNAQKPRMSAYPLRKEVVTAVKKEAARELVRRPEVSPSNAGWMRRTLSGLDAADAKKGGGPMRRHRDRSERLAAVQAEMLHRQSIERRIPLALLSMRGVRAGGTGEKLDAGRTEEKRYYWFVLRELNRAMDTLFGDGRRRALSTWRSMIQRCTNPNHVDWNIYGGANPPVRICAEWMTFDGFFASMGDRPEGTSLSRFADTGDYCRKNCAWHTPRQQRFEADKKRALLNAPIQRAAAA